MVTRREQLGTDDHQLEQDKGRGRAQNRGRGRGRGRGKRNGKEVDEKEGEADETNAKPRKNEKKQKDETTEKTETDEGDKIGTGKAPRRVVKAKAKAKDKNAKPKTKAVALKRPAKSAARPSKSAKISESDKPKDKPQEQAPPPAPKGSRTWGGRWIPEDESSAAWRKMQAIKRVFEKCIADKVTRQSSLQPPFYKFCAAAFREHAVDNIEASMDQLVAVAELQVSPFLGGEIARSLSF